ncbi:hypothetical protein SI65_04389 [Aspergillus cristatus]|uniref:Uncharacterized protein n=1 Tax=Aspergillus cristatus TaxID=573508 RepID=A0A1E3BEK0_ASPCR|nr:hypothetical protein SI65_04389 [Aspergillus cristatus]
MTVKEAHGIMAQLQELEFPYAFAKARQIALLKAGGIPTMSKLFAVTGQNNRRNAGKCAVDTEILLPEAHSKPRDSDRYASAVARMNYLHDRYRHANKITDNDLHTLGDGLAEILNVVDREEWRKLTDVENLPSVFFTRTWERIWESRLTRFLQKQKAGETAFTSRWNCVTGQSAMKKKSQSRRQQTINMSESMLIQPCRRFLAS